MENLKITPNKVELGKWKTNLILFLAPVGIIYISALIGVLQAEGHVISLKDFIPSSFQLGAIALYVLNTLLDYLRKIKAS